MNLTHSVGRTIDAGQELTTPLKGFAEHFAQLLTKQGYYTTLTTFFGEAPPVHTVAADCSEDEFQAIGHEAMEEVLTALPEADCWPPAGVEIDDETGDVSFFYDVPVPGTREFEACSQLVDQAHANLQAVPR